MRGHAYDDLLDEFMEAVALRYGAPPAPRPERGMGKSPEARSLQGLEEVQGDGLLLLGSIHRDTVECNSIAWLSLA